MKQSHLLLRLHLLRYENIHTTVPVNENPINIPRMEKKFLETQEFRYHFFKSAIQISRYQMFLQLSQSFQQYHIQNILHIPLIQILDC